jgi:hypothetical protein
LLSKSDLRAARLRDAVDFDVPRAEVFLTDGRFLLDVRPLLATFFVPVFLAEVIFLPVFAAWRFLLLGRRAVFLPRVFFFDVLFFDDALAADLAGFFREVRFTEVFLPLAFFLAAAFLLGIDSPPRRIQKTRDYT